MTYTLTHPTEAHLTNGTKRSRAVRVAGPGPAVREFVSARQQMQSARTYAEAWYQALRHQNPRENGGMLVVGGGPARSNGRQMVPVVGNWNATPAGVTRYTEVHTPLGWLSQRSVTQAMTHAADPLLVQLQAGQGLSTLIHASGRGWAGEQARAYARSALKVAVALGDEKAAIHLTQLSNAED